MMPSFQRCHVVMSIWCNMSLPSGSIHLKFLLFQLGTCGSTDDKSKVISTVFLS